MAKNFVQPGSTVTLVAPAGGVLSGQAVLFDSLFGVVAYDAIEGAEVEVTVDGVWDLPKAAGVIAAGAPVFFDEALGVIKGASAVGLFRIGAAVAAAATDAPTARIRLDGISVTAVAA